MLQHLLPSGLPQGEVRKVLGQRDGVGI